MNLAVALVNIVLGLAYAGYGLMTAVEMRRDWRIYGFSHFGVAWIFMAFTCGPHHLDHGIHVLLDGNRGGALDVISVVIGLPVGILWLALRVEAFAGGRGDRYISGTPRWLAAVPTVAAVYVTALVAAAVQVSGSFRFDMLVIANVCLVGTYLAITWTLLRTQLRNRGPMQGWSLSGISLTAVFPTCALMHAVLAVYVLRGIYPTEFHSLLIDWLSVPASLYFLWVVQGLHSDALQDWNSVEAGVASGPDPAPGAASAA